MMEKRKLFRNPFNKEGNEEKPPKEDKVETVVDLLKQIKENLETNNLNQVTIDGNMKATKKEILASLNNLDVDKLKRYDSVKSFKERITEETKEVMFLKIPRQELIVSTDDVQELLKVCEIIGLEHNGLSNEKLINNNDDIRNIEIYNKDENEVGGVYTIKKNGKI